MARSPHSRSHTAGRAARGRLCFLAAIRTCRTVTALMLAAPLVTPDTPDAPYPTGEADPGKGEKEPTHQQQANSISVRIHVSLSAVGLGLTLAVWAIARSRSRNGSGV